MSPPPATPCVYHITHVDNLPAIIANGGLISDAAIIARGGPAATIGMSTIKQRRLSLPVSCHPVVAWANQQQRRWAFSLSNAGAGYAQFKSSLNDLHHIDWDAVASNNFSAGVASQAIANQASVAIANAAHQPQISVQPSWYF